MNEPGTDPLAAIAATLVNADTLVAKPEARADTPGSPAPASRYQHLSVLGEGGMGRVEKVLDRDLVREVAVKHLRADIAGNAALFEQFVWEARVTARLDHPHIVPLHDLGKGSGGRLFFTMKLVRGRTLEDVIREASKGAADPQRRLRMFLAICQAVAFAHARGVLHRDLKPGNVMIGEYGEVLVTDWGLALPLPDERGDALRAVAPAGLATTSAGTPAYMSPEQVRGEPLDARSDVWALGTILYELIALQPAFRGATVPMILAAVVAGDAPPLNKVAKDVPSSLLAVVSKAMALDPAERYREVHELVADVEEVLDGGTPSAEHASFARRAARFYVGRDRALRRLRVVEMDLWMVAAMTIGVAVGARYAQWVGAKWWLILSCGIVAGVPTTWRWIALNRSRDD